tara:strand:+ start:399 stop:644 length:246 start_codon:yes stop_codon:yes gene_type:complete
MKSATSQLQVKFKQLGYSVDYHVAGKFIGSITIQEPDREVIGYSGRITGTADNDIIFTNNKRIKKGEQYYTFLYPLCGRRI